MTPRTSGAQRVPPIRFAYFNPSTRQYESSLTDALGVQVAAGSVVAADSAVAPLPPPERPLALRPALGDEAPLPLGDLAFVRWLLLAAPVPGVPRVDRQAAASRARAVESRRAPAHDGRAAARRALGRRRAHRAARRRAAPHRGLDPASLTAAGAWARALRLEGGRRRPPASESLLDALDAAAFGGAGAGAGTFASRASALGARIDAEARRARPAFRGTQAAASAGAAALLLLAGAAAALLARDVERAREPFARGIAAYAGADYARAASLFADAARAAARRGGVGQRGHGLVGRRRYGRRCRRLAARAQARPDGRRPARPARARAGAAGHRRGARAAHSGAGAVGARASALGGRVARGRPRVLAAPAGDAAAARDARRRGGGAAAGARLWEERIEGRDLAVVIDPGALRALPALGAEGGAVPLTGEVAYVVQRKGVWTHIALDGDRDGWIASERLAPLGSGRD